MSFKDSINVFNEFRPCFVKLGLDGWFESFIQDLVNAEKRASGRYYENGEDYAGPGVIGNILVPDAEFAKASYIHDCCYSYIRYHVSSYGTLDHAMINKSEADRLFYECMLQTKAMYPFKRQRAFIYYKAVVLFGEI